MRKTSLIFLKGVLVIRTLMSTSFAQSLQSTVEFSGQPSIVKFISSFGEIDKTGYSNAVRLNELNAKAVRHFTREYKNVPDPRWSKSDIGFVAYFINEDIKNWVFYTANGYNLGKVSHYEEEKLDRYIRHRVKSTYYDFTIRHVSEVKWDDKLVYLISIEDRRSTDTIFFKMIRVVDEGEMEIVKEYSQKVNHEDSFSDTAER